MAAVFIVSDPDVNMEEGPWAVGFFRIGLSGCGEADGTEDDQGVVLTDTDLRGP